MKKYSAVVRSDVSLMEVVDDAAETSAEDCLHFGDFDEF